MGNHAYPRPALLIGCSSGVARKPGLPTEAGYQVWATSARRRCSGDQTGFNTIKLDVSDGLRLGGQLAERLKAESAAASAVLINNAVTAPRVRYCSTAASGKAMRKAI
jgi:hypothetical protein